MLIYYNKYANVMLRFIHYASLASFLRLQQG